MKTLLILFCLCIFFPGVGQIIKIGAGEQPQLSVDASGMIRLVYGENDKIFYCTSSDNGASFSKPELVGEVSKMHLGMTRGPQLASSRDYSIVTAMDESGNIHSFQLDHRSGKWSRINNVNDQGSAPEGLMSISADDANHFYAVWLDLAGDKNNKIAFSELTSGSWSKTRIVYTSPDKTVCECCKPSVAVRGKNVSLMFRNWVSGSRDLYLMTSVDGGRNFGTPVKLGSGTWKLKGCPMDGGGVLIDKKNVVHTVWQREGVVYYDRPGEDERKIATGKGCGVFGGEVPFMTWQENGKIFGQFVSGSTIDIGEGSAVDVVQLKGDVLLAAWENDGHIQCRKLEF